MSASRQPNEIIDLRSDTVTRPSPDMRKAIAAAPVGDDQFGEDPTVNRLQEMVAETLGKEKALWLPTGTMANQVAVRILTRPGDDVAVTRESHVVWHETGAAAANSGVQFTELGERGVFTVGEFLAAVKPRTHLTYPPTTLVSIENTHNRAGGVIFPQDEVGRICDAARKHSISSYLDGARLWNAAIASNKKPAELAEPFDLASVAFSKGLGAPGGSALAGSRELIERAVRYRRMFGGSMRQAGILAAACVYGLEHNMERLADDHVNAKLIAEKLAGCKRIVIEASAVKTNIVIFGLAAGAPDAAAFVARARDEGVLIFAFGPRTIRAVTHLDVTRGQCERAAEIFVRIADSQPA